MHLTIEDFQKVTGFLTTFPSMSEDWNRSSEEQVGFEIDLDFKRKIPPSLTRYQSALAIVIYNDAEMESYTKRNGRCGVAIKTLERYYGEWEAMVEEFLYNNPDFNKYAWYSRVYLKSNFY